MNYWASVDELVYNIETDPLLRVALLYELVKGLHDLSVSRAEYALDLVNSESTPSSVVVSVLDVKDVDVIVALLLLRAQTEELCAIKTAFFRVEKVPEELEELS